MLNGTKPVNSNRDLRSKVLATAASSWNDIEESLSNCLPPTAPRELREATLDRARQEWKQPIPFLPLRWLLATAASLAFAFTGAWYESAQNQKFQVAPNSLGAPTSAREDRYQDFGTPPLLAPEASLLVVGGYMSTNNKSNNTITWLTSRNR